MRFLGLGSANRRRMARVLKPHSVTVFSKGVRIASAQMVDESEAGVRISWRQSFPLPTDGVLYDHQSARVMSFRRVWQRAGYAGLQVRRKQSIRGLLSPEFQRVKLAILGQAHAA